MKFTVAAIQMNSGEIVDDNLEKAEQLIAQAVKKNACLIALPEMFALMSQLPEKKIRAAEEYGKGPIQDFLKKQSRHHHIWLVGGTIPIKKKNNEKVSACCLLYNPDGEIVSRYDKIHLFDAQINSEELYQESAGIIPGEKISLTDTPLGKLGLGVCYDIRFPELFRTLFNQGAEIFIIPAAFTKATGQAHWEILMRARAIENFSYVIGACQVGEHSGNRFTYGHSLIINPWGEVLAKINSGVGIITAEINLDQLHQIRQKMPVKLHQKIFTTR